MPLHGLRIVMISCNFCQLTYCLKLELLLCCVTAVKIDEGIVICVFVTAVTPRLTSLMSS